MSIPTKLSLDDVKSRFSQEVKLRAYDDRYIDKNEEREILQIALVGGISVDEARGALNQVCDTSGYVVESRVLKEVGEAIEVSAQNDGKIDQKEFNDAVALLKKKVQDKKNDVQCKRLVIGIIEDNSYKVKTGG